MIIIGIVGGVASGKSVVAAALEKLGAYWLDADAIGHEVLRLPETIRVARQRWGDQVLDDSGNIIRSVVAGHVFGESELAREELSFWEKWTHPLINRRLDSTIQRLRSSRKHPALVLDAPVMFKAGWDARCDHILFVDAPIEVRWQRALDRGWTREQFEAREASQLPIADKKRRSNFVIDNSGTLDQTYDQVLDFWNSLSH